MSIVPFCENITTAAGSRAILTSLPKRVQKNGKTPMSLEPEEDLVYKFKREICNIEGTPANISRKISSQLGRIRSVYSVYITYIRWGTFQINPGSENYKIVEVETNLCFKRSTIQ